MSQTVISHVSKEVASYLKSQTTQLLLSMYVILLGNEFLVKKKTKFCCLQLIKIIHCYIIRTVK